MARRVCVCGGHVVCVKVGVGSVAKAGAVAALSPDQQRAASASGEMGCAFAAWPLVETPSRPFPCPSCFLVMSSFPSPSHLDGVAPCRSQVMVVWPWIGIRFKRSRWSWKRRAPSCMRSRRR